MMMNLNKPNALLFIPDGTPEADGIERTTVMGIGAHQDDLEIMSYQGILQCFGKKDEWYFGVVVTNGAGSPRSGPYASCTDPDMQRIRKSEQKKAAYVGEYGALAMLDYTSSEVKDGNNEVVISELKALISAARPRIVYTHNLADKHDTHVSVTLRVLSAIRQLPEGLRPEKVYGCEVWRALDWMMDNEKTPFDVADHPNLSAAVLGVYDSQIVGGKRYDLATTGRRLSNATYAESHGTDTTNQMAFAMDLTPLVKDPAMDISDYVLAFIRHFSEDVSDKLKRFGTKA
jgi:LmbE family N-acetylglucosaminyl deacetylase